MGEIGDYWREAKEHRKAAERRIGRTECLCGVKVWNNAPKCHRCGRANDGYQPPKKAKKP